jgi:hypothetical protein
MAQMLECLPTKHEVLNSNSSTAKKYFHKSEVLWEKREYPWLKQKIWQFGEARLFRKHLLLKMLDKIYRALRRQRSGGLWFKASLSK